MKKKIDVLVGDLVLFPTDDKYNFHDQYGIVVAILPNYFGVPKDEEESLDDGTAYRIQWLPNGHHSDDYSIEDVFEASGFREAFLKKHPDNESY